ncbi:MAG TPA: winged helix-turn-helix transcriptional regulator [Burkholderiaceae bacterium]|nr:winged helix-turn-helix transcriptional regulator [Burkholderiaceae bacterium]
MNARSKEVSLPSPQSSVGGMVESVVGCKWSMVVLAQIRAGVVRPGAIERAVPGLSKKVLNERLRKLQRFGIVERTVYPEVPPRVEYRMTAFGRRFGRLIDEVQALQSKLDSAKRAKPTDVPVAGSARG